MTRRRNPIDRRRAMCGAFALAAVVTIASACSGPRGVLAEAGTTAPARAVASSTTGTARTPTTPVMAVVAASSSDSSSSTSSSSTSSSSEVATIDLPSESGGPARVTPPPTVDASGAPVTLPGITHTAELGGYTRSWIVVAPAIAETTRPRPLVILLHGLAADGTILQQALGFDPLADGTDVVLAYPDAIDGAWNDERADATSSTAHQSHIDDVAFLDHIIDDAVAADRVDPNRVAVVGFSNGGMMASYYACVRADRVRAIAVVAGAGGAGLNARCNPTRPVSVLAIHSRRDRVVPFQGGPIAADTGHWGSSAPVPLMLDRWRAIAGCQGIVDRVYTSAAPVVTEQHAYGCRPGVEVVLERVESKVHGWLSDPTFMTTDIVWQFVVEHTLVPA